MSRSALKAAFRLFGIFVIILCPVSQALALEALSINPAWIPKSTAAASAPATIRGMGFDPASTVTFDGVAAAVTFVNSRTLTVLVPLSATGKIARVVVTNPGGVTDDLYPFIYTDKNLYASETGSDSNNGTSAATPKRTIRAAIDLATSAPTYLIRVTEGRFGANSLPLPNGAVLAGGYNLAFTVRDPDLYISDVDSGQFNFGLRSFGLNAKVVVDGLTFMNGLRDGSSGGSLEFIGDQTVVSNNVVVGNQTSGMAGGVYIGFSTLYGGRATLTGNVVLGNRAFGGPGGGLVVYPFYTQGNAIQVALTDNFIVGNRSFRSRGGGIALHTNSFYGYNSLNFRLMGNVVAGNIAMAGSGIDLNLATNTDTVNFFSQNNLIAGNLTSGTGGGLTITGLGALDGFVKSSTIAANETASGQSAGITFGSAITVRPSFLAQDVISWGNMVEDADGPVSLLYSDVGGGVLPGAGNISADPLYRLGPQGSFYLEQGVTPSAALDTGSGTVADAGVDGSTTAADGTPDTGMADMGMHYELPPMPSVNPLQFVRLDPDHGDMLGSAWILVRGKGFDPGARVFFGTPEAQNTLYVSSTRLIVQPPARTTPVNVGITITNPDNETITITNAYEYMDVLPPVWTTTVGAQAATSPLDCVRSVIVDWNAATDQLTPPVKYEVYKFSCDPAPGASPPCVNYTDFIPSAGSPVVTTSNLSWVDTAFSASGADPQFLYIVRAIDSQTPENRELNLSKRHAIASKNVADVTPPALVGNTVTGVKPAIALAWAPSRGAVSYRVYRETNPAAYATPLSLVPFVTLTTANNDPDLDGITNAAYSDLAVPLVNQVFCYKITALDPCSVESRNDLLP